MAILQRLRAVRHAAYIRPQSTCSHASVGSLESNAAFMHCRNFRQACTLTSAERLLSGGAGLGPRPELSFILCQPRDARNRRCEKRFADAQVRGILEQTYLSIAIWIDDDKYPVDGVLSLAFQHLGNCEVVSEVPPTSRE